MDEKDLKQSNTKEKGKQLSALNFYAPKYAEYIWKGHASNFIKYIDELDSGEDDRITKMTDLAIADIWAVLEDDEKTLDILARHSNLSISLRPKFMESLSTVDQINYGLYYIVQALSYVHARTCYININNKQFHVAETYIMQFENMSWWKKVIEQNKKFGGQELLEEDLVYKVMDTSFNWLKSVVLENRNMFDNAIRMVKPGIEMMAWRFNLWDNDQKRCPEPYVLSESDKEERIKSIQVKKANHILRPFDKDEHPILFAYRERLQKDKANGNLTSIKTMLETGIFWSTVKCPKCAREAAAVRYFFYNPCKLCRQIQATALLGHMPCDDKFFGWIFKEGSTITDDDFQRIKDEEESQSVKLKDNMDKNSEERSRRIKDTQRLLNEADDLLKRNPHTKELDDPVGNTDEIDMKNNIEAPCIGINEMIISTESTTPVDTILAETTTLADMPLNKTETTTPVDTIQQESRLKNETID